MVNLIFLTHHVNDVECPRRMISAGRMVRTHEVDFVEHVHLDHVVIVARLEPKGMKTQTKYNLIQLFLIIYSLLIVMVTFRV